MHYDNMSPEERQKTVKSLSKFVDKQVSTAKPDQTQKTVQAQDQAMTLG